MDIVLDTRFNNPNLPTVQYPGFTDDFDRPVSATLGSTSGENRPWQVYEWPESGAAWGIAEGGTASAKNAGGPTAALVDALTPNGTLTARIASVNPAARYGGLILRWQDIENYIAVAEQTSSNHRLAIVSRKAGTPGEVKTNSTAPVLVSGDNIAVTLQGTDIRVALNGVEILTADVPDFAGSTKFGFYAHSGTDSRWDSIKFTP